MKKIFVVATVLSTLSYNVFAASCGISAQACLNGCCPEGAPNDNYLVNQNIFTLSANKTTKFADWVSYIVEPQNVSGPSRTRTWKKDPNIPAIDTMSPNDYTDANATCGYDRGHQAPLAAFSNNDLWANTNYLSNITPQMAALNQGSWERLEDAERKLLSKYTKVYVVTGPYYTGEPMCGLPKSSVPAIVPNGYWKVVSVVDSAGHSQSVAFMFSQNTERTAKYCDYRTTISSVQSKTGLNVLPNKQDAYSNTLVADLGC